MTIKEAMEMNIITFSFKKVSDNSHRIASGTRDLNLIPKQHHPKGSDKPAVPGILTFFDWGKQAWRSCRYSSIFGSWKVTESHLLHKIEVYKNLKVKK